MTVVARILLLVVLTGLPFFAAAQDAARLPRVTYLLLGKPEANPRFRAAFVDGLQTLGYVDGQNIAIELRYSDADGFPALARDAIDGGTDVIVTASTQALRAAQGATKTVPIVFASISDPVAGGFVDTLARPGGNITGLTILSPELNRKRLQLIKETVPSASRVAVLQNPENPSTAVMSQGIEGAAEALRLRVRRFDAAAPTAFGELTNQIAAWRADAVLVLDDAMFSSYRVGLIAAAAERGLPLACPYRDMAMAGCLFSYGVDLLANFRRSAVYVDRILKGSDVASLPVENPARFEMVTNLKTAKALGLTMPQAVLLRSDAFVE
jgi:putative ABC transport system substrate-binding protein